MICPAASPPAPPHPAQCPQKLPLVVLPSLLLYFTVPLWLIQLAGSFSQFPLSTPNSYSLTINPSKMLPMNPGEVGWWGRKSLDSPPAGLEQLTRCSGRSHSSHYIHMTSVSVFGSSFEPALAHKPDWVPNTHTAHKPTPLLLLSSSLLSSLPISWFQTKRQPNLAEGWPHLSWQLQGQSKSLSAACLSFNLASIVSTYRGPGTKSSALLSLHPLYNPPRKVR